MIASYIDEAVEWKCLYRLNVPPTTGTARIFYIFFAISRLDDNVNQKGVEESPVSLKMFGEPILSCILADHIGQVRNPSDEDWHEVALSLVANELELLEKVKCIISRLF